MALGVATYASPNVSFVPAHGVDDRSYQRRSRRLSARPNERGDEALTAPSPRSFVTTSVPDYPKVLRH